MSIRDKFIIRKSILELAKTGTPRNASIDEQIRGNNKEAEEQEKINLWDSITALGAQLSRPPYDPYREIISLDITIGRQQCNNKVVLSMPMIIYDNCNRIEENSLNSIHVALNSLMLNNAINLGLISKEKRKDREYPLFKRIKDFEDYDSEGLILEYYDDKSIQTLIRIRKEFDGPILVEIDDSFADYIPLLLNAGADGFIVDTIKITNSQRYKGKHAIAVIYDIRYAINQYYAGRDNDGAVLVVAGDVNSTDKFIKSAALGADIIGYSISLLIANAESHNENPCTIDEIAQRICRHILATRGEIRGVPAAMGYSNIQNLSSKDLRTSSIDASLQADIAIEGIDKTYCKIIQEYIDQYFIEEKSEIDKEGKQELLAHLLKNR